MKARTPGEATSPSWRWADVDSAPAILLRGLKADAAPHAGVNGHLLTSIRLAGGQRFLPGTRCAWLRNSGGTGCFSHRRIALEPLVFQFNQGNGNSVGACIQ